MVNPSTACPTDNLINKARGEIGCKKEVATASDNDEEAIELQGFTSIAAVTENRGGEVGVAIYTHTLAKI